MNDPTFNWLVLTVDIQRSNYVEATLVAEDDEAGTAGASRRGGRQLISDKRNLTIPGTSPAATKKKSTMNVRTALLYQKNLAKHIEDSVRSCISRSAA